MAAVFFSRGREIDGRCCRRKRSLNVHIILLVCPQRGAGLVRVNVYVNEVLADANAIEIGKQGLQDDQTVMSVGEGNVCG